MSKEHVTLDAAAGRRLLAGDLSALDPPKAKAKRSAPEGGTTADILAGQLEARGISFAREVEFALIVDRKWRADFLLPSAWLGGVLRCVIVEVDGGVHKLDARFEGDRAKARAVQALGFHFLPFTSNEVRLGGAVAQIAALYSNGVR